MEFLINTFNLLLYQPLFNILILLYQFIPGQDLGLAIIILTLSIKFLFYPLTTKAIKSQRILTELQPKIREIQQKFKQDKEKQIKEIMALYQKEKINPFSGFLPMLIQLPILIALFLVFTRGFGPEQMVYLYDFIPHPETINFTSLGIINLAEGAVGKVIENGTEQSILLWPNIVLIILVSIAQFFQSKMLIPKAKEPNKKEGQIAQISSMVQKQMTYFMPFFTFLILLNLPSVMGLYWLVVTLFSIGQQRLVLKS
jgi:YidC/Oxa1 family membrane protein insertase